AAVTAALEREEDNFRQALRWSLDRGDAEALDIGLRLAGALGWFWFLHGYPSEARDWFDALLKPVEGPPSAVRAKALNAAGFRAYAEQALTVARQAGSTTWAAYSLYILASLAHERADVATAGSLYREALGSAWASGDRLCVRMALPGLAGLATLEGDPARAVRLAAAASTLERYARLVAFPPIRARQEYWLA